MQLTGKSIVKKGIVYNIDTENAIQQQGVDLRLDAVYKVHDSGFIPAIGKTIIPMEKSPVPLSSEWEWRDKEVFELEPGYYEVELMEGCNIPNNAALIIKSRSSLVRCGGDARSGQFDGGFKTQKMGCFLEVIKPLFIERGARIAQAIVCETEVVDDEDLYNGQFQGDKQRKN